MTSEGRAWSNEMAARPHHVVRVERTGRPPLPWAWKIVEEGRNTVRQRSERTYRCAEDAWEAGRAALDKSGPEPDLAG